MTAAEYRLRVGAGEVVLHVASTSHVGLVRSVNEDSVLAEPPVFAVADGMGGHAFGDRASATAVLALHEEFDPSQPTDAGHVLTAIRRANAAVRDLTAWSGEPRVIAGTTLTGIALVLEHPGGTPNWMVFNLGDSRVYRWVSDDRSAEGARRLERVSVDHSVVQELLDAGVIDEATARVHPDRNVITRALGAADEVAAEAWLLPATQSQTFLICSDGLTKEVDDATISAVLAGADGDPELAVQRLREEALEAGGADNVTILVVSSHYAEPAGADGDAGSDQRWVDEVTHDRGLSPEQVDTRPRL
jgi:serine/threonine protein phosphatase PrpC